MIVQKTARNIGVVLQLRDNYIHPNEMVDMPHEIIPIMVEVPQDNGPRGTRHR